MLNCAGNNEWIKTRHSTFSWSLHTKSAHEFLYLVWHSTLAISYEVFPLSFSKKTLKLKQLQQKQRKSSKSLQTRCRYWWINIFIFCFVWIVFFWHFASDVDCKLTKTWFQVEENSWCYHNASNVSVSIPWFAECVTGHLESLTNDTLYFMSTLNQTLTCFEKYQQVFSELGDDVCLSPLSSCSDVRLLHFSLGEPHRAVQKLQERLWDPECAVQPNGKKQYSVHWHRGCGMYAGSGDKQTFSKWGKEKAAPSRGICRHQ